MNIDVESNEIKLNQSKQIVKIAVAEQLLKLQNE
jgi:hypothetical protein